MTKQHHFFDTIGLSETEQNKADSKAETQEQRIYRILVAYGKPATPSQVETIYNSMYPVIPITSVRRALTMGSLTEYKGKKLIPIFRKLATKDNGKYQYPHRQWEAIIKS